MSNIQKENINLASKISAVKAEANEQKRQAAIAQSVNESLEAQISKLSNRTSEAESENKKLNDLNQQKLNKIKNLEKIGHNREDKIAGLQMTIGRYEEDVKSQKDHYVNKISEREEMLKKAENDQIRLCYLFLFLVVLMIVVSDVFFCGSGTVVNWLNFSRLPNLLNRRC